MRRLLVSLAAGFVIPFVYTATTGPLSLHIRSERINYLLWLPVGWPKILYLGLLAPFTNRAHRLDDDSLFVLTVVCDVLLYGSLTYFFLRLRSARRRQTYDEPPPPPDFGGDE